MNITKNQFRSLLNVAITIKILGVIVSVAEHFSLPPAVRDYENQLGPGKLTLLLAGVPLIILSLVSLVGLYCFRPFARPLFVMVLICGLVLQIFTGPSVESGLASSLANVRTLLTGIRLAVLYLTPAKEWFAQTPTVHSGRSPESAT